MKYAVHNYHTPATVINEDGSFIVQPIPGAPVPEPLHVADTFEDAEAWRKSNGPNAGSK